MIIKNCINCKKEFKTYSAYIRRGEKKGRPEGLFCSAKCRSSGKFNSRYNGGLEIINRKCLFCKKQFGIIKRLIRLRPAKFCSILCAYKGQIKLNRSRILGGYKYLYKKDHPFANSDGMIAEHRLVMEDKIGRFLTKKEIIHHINHKKLDNRIKNLMILDNKTHNSLHKKGVI